MRHAILMTLMASLVGACSVTAGSNPVKVQADSAAVCEALRPDYPLDEVKYHGKSDKPDTIERIKANNLKNRSANARFRAACP